MKYYFKVALLLLFFASCKNTKHENLDNSPQLVVGTYKNDTYTVTSEALIKQEWERSVSTDEPKKLSDFKIVKTQTQGAAKLDCYLLMARTKDNKSSVASLLIQKDGNFYFDETSGITVLCAGFCAEGCLPIVTFKKGIKQLVCTVCADCVKSEMFINL